jgi:hypothetical protein
VHLKNRLESIFYNALEPLMGLLFDGGAEQR